MSFVQTVSFESMALPLKSQSSTARSNCHNVLTPRRTPAAYLHSNSCRSNASSLSSSQLSVSSFTSSSSTIAGRSMRRSNAPPSGSLLGRPTRASLLRMKSCPIILSEPDYKEMVRKKKEFVKHSKSMSVTAIMESAIPEGESMHAFLTGARYNSAQCVDSKSLARLGVYVARGSEARSFVNTAPAQRAVPKHSSSPVSKQQAWTSPVPPQRHHSPVNTISTSTSSIDRELAQIFGPDDDYSDSSLATSQLFNESIFINLTPENKGILKTPNRPFSCDDRLLRSSPLKPKLSLVSFSSKVKVNEDNVMVEEYAESESTASSAIDEEEEEEDEDRLNMVSPIAQQLAKDILKEALDADSISSDDTTNDGCSTPTNGKQNESNEQQQFNVFMTDPQNSPLHSKAMVNFKDIT